MKKVFIFLILFLGIYAQKNIGFTTGLNLSKMFYPEDGIEPSEINFKPGFNIGLEIEQDWMKAGFSFQQKGTEEVLKFDDTTKVIGNYLYNFPSFHLLGQYKITNSFIGLAGFQAGYAINEELKTETVIGTVKIKEILQRDIAELRVGWDLGLLIGAEYMVNPVYGLRVLYHHSLLPKRIKHRSQVWIFIYFLCGNISFGR